MRKKFIWILTIIVIVGITAVKPIMLIQSVDYVKITITDKERITTGSGDNLESVYLIYTDKETFQNKDALIFWKLNSSDFQEHFKIGNTYKVKVAGWRIPFLSSYRNIVDYEK